MTRPPALLRWLLVIFLLLGQSLSLAHDHDADHDAEPACALCLHAQHADAVIAIAAGWLSPGYADVLSEYSAVNWPVTVAVPPFNPRAPPYTSC